MVILDGKKLASQIEVDIANKVKDLSQNGITPSLAVILVGNDAASQTYVAMKAKACKRVGITSILHEMPYNITQQDLLAIIEKGNGYSFIDV